jgi:putative heme-binding domain-containing protein
MFKRYWPFPSLLLAATVLMSRAEQLETGSTSPGELDQGKRLYAVHCASCHGPNGEGSRGPTLAQPKLPRAPEDASLARIITSGISGTEMPRARLERADVMLLVAYVRSLGARPIEQVAGDPQRGKSLYFEKGQCAKCHVLNGEGSVFGGDLSDVGRMRSAVYLRRALTEPNADVPQSFSRSGDGGFPANFLYVRVITKDGRDISGVRINEDTFSIQLRQSTGAVFSFFKDEVQLDKTFGKSPMPSYADAFSKEELDDLVAFLVSLRGQR